MPNNNSLTLVIPDLLPKVMAKYISLPQALKLLLSRAAKITNPTHNSVQLLFYLFGYSYHGELPVAAVTGLMDGLDTTHDYWLRMDPVELRADLSAVYLIGNQHLTDADKYLSPTILQQLHELLQLDHLNLLMPAIDRWYLQMKQDPAVNTQPLPTVIGKNIYTYMPEGVRRNYWRQLFTELQMLLHHPTMQREQQINAVWLWGAGKLPEVVNSSWQAIFTDNLLTQGLAKLANKDPAISINVVDFLDQIKHGEYLIVLDAVEPVLGNWFSLVLKALRSGKLKQLNLYLGDEYCYQISAQSVWYFWRRNHEIMRAIAE